MFETERSNSKKIKELEESLRKLQYRVRDLEEESRIYPANYSELIYPSCLGGIRGTRHTISLKRAFHRLMDHLGLNVIETPAVPSTVEIQKKKTRKSKK